MDVKRIAAALLVAMPILVAAPAAYGDDASQGGPVLDFARPEGDESAAPVEVAGAAEGDQEYAAGLAAWPQPSTVRIQSGMVSTRALMRYDNQNGGGYPEVAGVIFSGGVEVAGVQVGQLSDPEYLSRVVAYPQPPIRVQPGMVSLRSLQRGDSLNP